MAVKIKEYISQLQVVKYSVPQPGSVVGHMLFNMYCLPLTALIRKYGVSYHVYTDDTQLYVECDKTYQSYNRHDTEFCSRCLNFFRILEYIYIRWIYIIIYSVYSPTI